MRGFDTHLWTAARKKRFLDAYIATDSQEMRDAMLESNEMSRQEIDEWALAYSEHGIKGLRPVSRFVKLQREKRKAS